MQHQLAGFLCPFWALPEVLTMLLQYHMRQTLTQQGMVDMVLQKKSILKK